MTKALQVGIIGASARRGWARDAHVPAVRALAGLELAAVATGSQRGADEAARAFGAAAGYGDGLALIADPAVDLVTIAVKVPDHRALVLAALQAGKHVYCEWPLGCDLAEAQEMADAARAAGVHVAIGLQTRANPALRQARAAIAAGAIGRVLSARILSTTMAFGPDVDAAMAFGEEAANGVTLVTIQGAHTVDLALAVLGPLDAATALATTQFPHIMVGDPPAPHVRSTADHLLLQGRFRTGQPLAIEVAGGRPADATPFRLEVIGETGTLALGGGAPRGVQSARLWLEIDGAPVSVEEGEAAGLPDAAANIAGIYAALRDDILHGTSTVPDFEHAVRLTRLMADLMTSSRTGVRAPATDWPQHL